MRGGPASHIDQGRRSRFPARVLLRPAVSKLLAESKVHQISRAWVTNDGWSSSLISKIWRTVRSGNSKDSKKYM